MSAALLERTAAQPPPAAPLAAHRRPSSAGRALVVLTALVAAASAAGTALSQAGDPTWLPVPLRAAVAVLAACTLPGVPLVLLLRPASRAVGTALAVSSSLAVTVLAAQASLMAGWWHPAVLQSTVVGASLVLLPLAWSLQPAAPRGWAGRAARTALAAVGRRALPLAAVAGAAACTVVQARALGGAQPGALGLVGLLGWPALAALLLLGAAVAAGLRRPRPDHLVLVLAAGALVVLTTSLLALADGETSVPTAWVHRRFIDVVSVGHLPPPVDARFSWAAFFAAGAHLVAVAGLPDATVLMAPATAFLDVLALAPLYVIGRAVTGRGRTAWVGIVLYLLCDWYQQDYFAPQSLALLWWTTALAVLLWWWRAAPGPQLAGTPLRRALGAWRRTPGLPAGTSAAQALGTEALLALLLVAVVATHQLTPLAATGGLAVLALAGATRFRSLWLVSGLAFTAWFSFAAEGFWSGHLAAVLGDVGNVGGSVAGGVAERVGTDPLHQDGQYLRIASSAGLGALAVVGWWLRRGRRGQLLAGLLAAVPFGLVAVQSYGGEVVIRCFVLASPLLAPLAAEAVVRTGGALARWAGAHEQARGVLRPATAVLVALAVAAGGELLVTTRGLNASFERVTAEQVRVADELLEGLPGDQRVLPWGNAPYLFNAQSLSGVFTWPNVAPSCLVDLAACSLRDRPDYVVLTPQMEAEGVYTRGEATGWLEAGRDRLLGSGEYVVQVATPSITVLRLATTTDVLGGDS